MLQIRSKIGTNYRSTYESIMHSKVIGMAFVREKGIVTDM